MKTILRAWTLAVVAVAAMGIFASTAMALPAGFWGVVPQSGMTDEQFQRLNRGGVESTRLPVSWEHVQASPDDSFNWSGVDDQIEAASKAGIKVLPFLTGAPRWAVPWSTVPQSGGLKAPARLPVRGAGRAGWISFVTAAVARYGPSGTFWDEHPGIPKRPIRNWQIWNEPNFKYFIAKPNPSEYGKLVKISYNALKAADPRAQAILAGLFSRPRGARDRKTGKHKSLNWFASDFIERMYKTTPGVKSKFNAVALHPYTINARELPDVTEELRNTLKDNRDAGKPLWITEISWSSKRKTGSNLFGKGRAGQARELRKAFATLRKKQRAWKVKSVFWFSVDDVEGACNFCDGSGLFGDGFKPKPSWFSYVKFAGGTP